jgi:TonB family protein
MVQKPVAILVVLALGSACASLQAPELVPIVRVDQLDSVPVLQEFPEVAGADSLRGSATVQCVVDTAGRIVKDLILVLANPSTDLSEQATRILLQARFSRPRVGGVPRRALVELTFDLGSRTAFVSPRLSDRIVWLAEMADEKPEVLSGPALWYPDRARQAGITGRVIVQAIIGPDGRAEPASVRLVKFVDHDLDAAALRYVHSATFKAARIGGRSVRTLVNLPIDFKIRRTAGGYRP